MRELTTDSCCACVHVFGGFCGEIAKMALVAQIADAVRPLPVVAAGGIADGSGVGRWRGADGRLVDRRSASVEAMAGQLDE